jgi:hypothetical protein
MKVFISIYSFHELNTIQDIAFSNSIDADEGCQVGQYFNSSLDTRTIIENVELFDSYHILQSLFSEISANNLRTACRMYSAR